MSHAWLAIGGLACATAVLRGAGPAMLNGRPLPPRATAVVALLAPALLASLIVTSTFASRHALTVDARAAGLACAGAAVRLRASPLATIVLAAAATALAHALA